MTLESHLDDQDRAELEALEHSRAFLANNHEAILELDEQTTPTHFIQDNTTGKIIAAVPAATFFAAQHVLHIPDLDDDALKLVITPEQIEDCAETDRLLAHCPEPNHLRFAACWIDSARHGPWVFDGDAFMQPNPLAQIEPEICKLLNADKPKLIALCDKRASTHVEHPICVAIDPYGLSIRARFGIVRVPFPDAPITDPAITHDTIKKLCE